MRLTCPNCGAQYEVPDEVIPETGRDVQCSNCGDTWFQHHPDHPAADEAGEEKAPHPGWDSPEDEPETNFASEEDEALAEDQSVPEPDTEAEEELRAEPEPTPEPETAGEEAAHAEDEGEPHETPLMDAEEEQRSPSRRGLDPSIADVLRQEAAREQEARESERGGGLEMQPDLGLDESPDESDQRSQQARSRMARMRGLSEDGSDHDLEEDPEQGMISRRNLLPDIDEINSSLDAESDRSERGAAASDPDANLGVGAQKRGFNRGFMRGVVLVLVLVLFYLLGPVLAEKVPTLAGVVSAYVETVNAGRLWLNDMVGGLL